ncbi:MAG TPA: DUF4038 domain-containing protein [Kineosporiaceae bacterium]|nr:DUF4038 domain-containing protein [Kineosporiaceae bacterium]
MTGPGAAEPVTTRRTRTRINRRTAAALMVLLLAVVVALVVVARLRTAPAGYPVKVSANGRYLVDQSNRPVFYDADTCWTLLSYLSLDDARTLIDIRRSQGFNAIQTVLEPLGKTTTSRVRAEPFIGGDLTRPNEKYWTVVDQILTYAGDQGMLLYTLPWWTSGYGDGGRPVPTTADVRKYMTWVGERYRDRPNLIWVMGGDDEPSRLKALKESAAEALKAADPNHLMTYHPRWDDWTFKDARWLDLNSFQKNDIDPPYSYQQVREGYDLSPTKPVLDAEPPYEPNTAMQEGDVTTPLLNRRFGWWAALAGAMGVTYGGPSGAWKINKEKPPDWDADIRREQAKHTGNIRRILTRFVWYRLAPDWDDATVTGGRGGYGDADYAPAERADDGSLMVAYAPGERKFNVDLSRLSGPATAQWYDPTTGNASGSPEHVTNSGTQSFATPGTNAAGDDDWVLVISTANGRADHTVR